MRSNPWLPIEGAPKDGTPVWVSIGGTHIARLPWWSAEAKAVVFGGSAEQYRDGFLDLSKPGRTCDARWWVPDDVLSEAPASGMDAAEGGRDRNGLDLKDDSPSA